MEPDQWKEVPGYPKYSVSKDGQVKSTRYFKIKGTTKVQIIKPYLTWREPCIRLAKKGVRRWFTVKSLLAWTYVTPPDHWSRLDVQLIDPAKGNHADNVRYVFKSHNPRMREAKRKGATKLKYKQRYGDPFKSAKLSRHPKLGSRPPLS